MSGARGSFKPKARFSPSSISAVSAWMRVASATSNANGISSLPDLLNTNPAVQATNSRKPGTGSAANGLPIMTFDGGDMLGWPLIAANNSNTQNGFALWYKPASVAAAIQVIIGISGDTGSATNYKRQVCQLLNNFAVKVFFTAIANGRQAIAVATVVVPGTWYFITAEYDAAAATEALRNVLTINGVVQTLTFSDQGTGGAGPNLISVTGNALIGAQSTTPANPIQGGGAIGPNIFSFNAKMAGATEGLLTPAARAALMTFEAPT